VVPGFDWSRWTTGTSQERLGLVPAGQEHILKQQDGKDRCIAAVRELSQAFALAVPHAEAMRICDHVGFFQAVRAGLAKHAPGDNWTLRENVRAHLRVLVKRILFKHGYPPDKQEKATQTVLEQAALLSSEWAPA
jgi:type I restriction enzyme R subunit